MQTHIPSEVEIIQRAKDMVPALRATAAAIEAAGVVSEANVAMMTEAGFFRVLKPKAFGGYEMNPHTLYQVIQTVASGCPSTGWVLMVLSIHNWEIALLDPSVAGEVWKEDPDILISSSYAPFGKTRRVDGGFMLSGAWPFSSGCNHAQWAQLGALAHDENGGDPELIVHLISRQDYDIIEDSWDVCGLAGTGSKTLKLKGEVFIPDIRTHSLTQHFLDHGAHEVGLKTFTNPIYQIPFGVAFHNAVASAVIGMAKGMLEVFQEQMMIRTDTLSGAPVVTKPALQRRAQIADMKIRSGQNLIRNVVEDAMSYLNKGEKIPMDQRARFVADAASVGELASEASVLLFRGTGGRGVMNSSPVQRYFRDIQGGCNHICMDLDTLGINAGGTLLGNPNQVVIS